MAMQLGFDIETLTPAKKKLLFVLPPLIVIVLSLVLLIMPSLEEKGILSAEVEKQNNEIQIAQRTAAKLPVLMAENERLQGRLIELQLRLPEEREVIRLLRQVSEQGRKAGLRVILWRPGEKKVHVSGEVYEIPVNVEMKGGYHRFGQFFSNITRIDRIVNISNINMRMAQQEQNQRGVTDLTVSFTAMTYSLIPEEERKAIEKAAKEGRK
jgi:type IV pilus assembly protein PilO